MFVLKRILVAAAAAFGISLVLVSMTFAWEARLLGRPGALAGDAAFGIYAWNDDDGLHIRSVANRDYDHHFSGTVTTDGQIFNVHLNGPADDDTYSVSGNRKQLTFSFNTYDGRDGIDYVIDGGSYQSVSAYYQGGLMDVENIYLGAGGAHPEYNPFTDTR
jgi:hypothetical protein